MQKERIVQFIMLTHDTQVASDVMHILKTNNFANHVESFVRADEALLFLNKNKSFLPKLIIVENDNNTNNTITFLDQLRSNNNFKSLPVMVLIAQQEEEQLFFSSFKGKHLTFLTKPFSFEDFTNKVSNVGLYLLIVKSAHV